MIDDDVMELSRQARVADWIKWVAAARVLVAAEESLAAADAALAELEAQLTIQKG